MSIKKRYINSIKSRVYDQVVANYRKIDGFTLGELSYNYKCHLNAVQKVKEGKATKVLACIAINKKDWKEIIVHFINQLDDGKYQDNTWGWVYEDYNYYAVKEVAESEYDSIGGVLSGLQDSLVESNSNALIRKILKINTAII